MKKALSARKLEAAALVWRRNSNKEIAAVMGIKEESAGELVEGAFHDLGLTDRNALADWYQKTFAQHSQPIRRHGAAQWLAEAANLARTEVERRIRERMNDLTTGADPDEILLDRLHVPAARAAAALVEYYGENQLAQLNLTPYRLGVPGALIDTGIVTRPGWLGLNAALRIPIIGGRADRSKVRSSYIAIDAPAARIDQVVLDRAIARIARAEVLDALHAQGKRDEGDTPFSDDPIYLMRSFRVDANGSPHAEFRVANFIRYALTLGLLENEAMDRLAALPDAPLEKRDLPLRARLLPDSKSLTAFPRRDCAGGVLCLVAIRRPREGDREADYGLILQRRSLLVVDGQERWTVVPQGFHTPWSDYAGDADLGMSVQRELEEELFGRAELAGLGKGHQPALFHFDRLSAPMQFLVKNGGVSLTWVGLGINLMNGNYEAAVLVCIEDEAFWEQHNASLTTIWETWDFRVISTMNTHELLETVSSSHWMNEGRFAFCEAYAALQQRHPDRVLPKPWMRD